MRYLKQREEFLNNNKFSNYSLIKEDSGPLANDIPWGDSLLGRLINSVIRKAGVGIDLLKIDPLIKRLNEEFDFLLDDIKIKGSNLSTQTLSKINGLQISALIGKLQAAVNSQSSKQEIKNITTGTIDTVTNMSVTADAEDDKKELIDKLNEFLGLIGEDKEESKSVGLEEMITNLSHLSKILELSGGEQGAEKTKVKFDRSKIKVGEYYLHRNSKGEVTLLKVASIDKDKDGKPLKEGELVANLFNKINFKWISTQNPINVDTIFKSVRVEGEFLNQEDTNLVSKDKKIPVFIIVKSPVVANKTANLPPKKSLESIFIDSEMIYESNEEANVDKFKKSVSLLIKNDKGISINKDFINELINQAKSSPDDKGSNGVLNSASFIVKTLYKEIYSCLKGERSKTLQEPDKLVESIELLRKDRTKIPVIAELIARFAKRSLQFEDGNKFESLGEVGKEVHAFNTTLNEILSAPKEEAKPEVKTESLKLHKYHQFINESEDTESLAEAGTEEKQGKPKEDDMKMPFSKIFSEDYLNKWITTEKDAKQVEKEVEEATKDGKGAIGTDHIVEIVKLFNRAHKIHTQPTIQTGRTGGKVSNKTFREYTWVGEGQQGTPAAPSVGAWRNNALFDKWESAVLDIIKNPKYQVIFNEKTTIKYGEADERVNISPDKKQGGGKTLLTFMNSLLDGDALYKKGAQSKFIEEYFGVKTTKLGLGDEKENKKEGDKKVYSFAAVKEMSKDPGTIYAVKSRSDTYYITILKEEGGYTYFKWSKTFKKFAPIAKKVSAGCKIEAGSLDKINYNETFPAAGGQTLNYIDHYGRIDSQYMTANGKNKQLVFKAVGQGGKQSDEAVDIKGMFGLVSADNKLLVIPVTEIDNMTKELEKLKNKLK